MKTFKILGVHISEDLAWSHNTTHLKRKCHQCLYILIRLKKIGMPAKILSHFYRGTTENILTSSMTVWFVN